MRPSCGKYDAAKIESVVELVSAVGSPPAVGITKAFQMPERLAETRIFVPSAENDAPENSVFLERSATEYGATVGTADARAGAWREVPVQPARRSPIHPA